MGFNSEFKGLKQCTHFEPPITFSFLAHMISSTPCSRTPSICVHHPNITSHTSSSYMNYTLQYTPNSYAKKTEKTGACYMHWTGNAHTSDERHGGKRLLRRYWCQWDNIKTYLTRT